MLPMNRALLIGLAVGLAATAQGDRSRSSVSFIVVDAYGRSLPYQVRSFVNKATKRSQLSAFRGLTGVGLRKGDYEYELARAGVRKPHFSLIRGVIQVFYDEHWVTAIPPSHVLVSLRGEEGVVDMEGPASGPSGRIQGCPSNSRCWLQLASPYTGKKVEVPIHKDGSFVVEQGLLGFYLVSAFSDVGHLCTTPMTFTSKKLDRLDLDCRGQRQSQGPPFR